MAEKGDASVTISFRSDTSDIDKGLAKLKKKIEKTEDEIQKIRQSRDKANSQMIFSAEELDKEKAKLAEMRQELLEIQRVSKDRSYSPGARESAKLSAETLKGDISDQQARVRMMQAEFNKLASSVENYDRKLKEASETLESQKDQAGELLKQIEEAPRSIDGMRKATEKAKTSMENFNKHVKSLARRALVFSVISKALSALKDWMSKVIKTDEEATKAIAKLKGALLTLAQPLVEVVIPAFTSLVNILAKVAAAVASVISKLFGTTASKSASAAKDLYEKTKALERTGEAADSAANSLAGFDEINTIGAEEGTEESEFGTGQYKDKLGEIEAYVSGAALAIGAILCFSGANVPLGLGLMALGAIGLADELSENWDTMNDKVKGALTRVLTTLGGAALVIGAILCLSGANIPLGISLMVAGAAMLATSIGLNWGSIGKQLSSTIAVILTALGGVAFVIGAILCFSGANIPLGIGLMVLGAAALGTAVGISWESIPNEVKSVVTTILFILGTALLVIGAVLCFAGPATMKLGIGLLAAGALALGSAVGLNWDYIVKMISDNIDTILTVVGAALLVLGVLLVMVGVKIPLGIGLIVAGVASMVTAAVIREGYTAQQVKDFITSILVIAGVGLLAFGLILCMTGVAIPIGIAMIVAGSVGLVTAAALNWGLILEKLKGMWEGIKQWWNTSVKKFFTLDYWKGLGSDIINGLLGGLKNAWKSITSWVSEKASWVANKFKGIFEDDTSTGTFSGTQTGGGRAALQSAAIQLSDVPALARGSVIPKNREFLAVLGDNKQETEVVSPVSTIKQAVLDALRESGGSGQTMEVKLYLDGKQIARNQVKHINDMTQAAGKPVLLF